MRAPMPDIAVEPIIADDPMKVAFMALWNTVHEFQVLIGTMDAKFLPRIRAEGAQVQTRLTALLTLAGPQPMQQGK